MKEFSIKGKITFYNGDYKETFTEDQIASITVYDKRTKGKWDVKWIEDD